MDSLTHAAMGAVIGQAGFSHKLGRRALGWGALVATLPDLDVIVKISSNPFAEVLYHRGVTHSLWFAPLVGPLLGYIVAFVCPP
jgi:inner membrane protein